MYPAYPESPADLVPLPRCDGPKLEPFDFQGPQNIEFLEYLGAGLHSHVVKVKIRGEVYALKLFRFVDEQTWLPIPPKYDREGDLLAVAAFGQYCEPFYAECRAFGRLKEAGHEDLAIGCFGYVLLSEENEAAMRHALEDGSAEGGRDIWFNGDSDDSRPDDDEWNELFRGRHVGKSGRLPPIRGILKEFGQVTPCMDLRDGDWAGMRRAMVSLQQLGIVRLDVAERQFISGKIIDFSTAITTPHFLLTAELNPHLTPEHAAAIENEAFRLSVSDYHLFDEVVRLFNDFRAHQWRNGSGGRCPAGITVAGMPGGVDKRARYNLRPTPQREGLHTFVDPRTFNWKAPSTRAPPERGGLGSAQRPGAGITRAGPLMANGSLGLPPMWRYRCDAGTFKRLRPRFGPGISLPFEFRDGLFYPLPSLLIDFTFAS